jgi:transposase-like protein
MTQPNTFTNLVNLLTTFTSEAKCIEYLAKIRWNGVPTCPYKECGHNKAYVLKQGSFKCAKCRKTFSVRVGTIFEESKITLQKWFVAVYLITSHKKGISSLQLGKDLGVTQKTAWFMLQRIRYAIRTKSFNAPVTAIVECDETYIGGKNKNRHANKKVKDAQGRSLKDKTPVFGMVVRDGKVLATVVRDTKAQTIEAIITQHVDKGATMMTDEYGAYSKLHLRYSHSIVRHSEGEYVNGLAHTNTIEGFWSLMKRGIIGIYHQVSFKHLDKYVDEFEFRYNTKETCESDRFGLMLQMSEGRLTYKELTA